MRILASIGAFAIVVTGMVASRWLFDFNAEFLGGFVFASILHRLDRLR